MLTYSPRRHLRSSHPPHDISSGEHFLPSCPDTLRLPIPLPLKLDPMRADVVVHEPPFAHSLVTGFA